MILFRNKEQEQKEQSILKRIQAKEVKNQHIKLDKIAVILCIIGIVMCFGLLFYDLNVCSLLKPYLKVFMLGNDISLAMTSLYCMLRYNMNFCLFRIQLLNQTQFSPYVLIEVLVIECVYWIVQRCFSWICTIVYSG